MAKRYEWLDDRAELADGGRDDLVDRGLIDEGEAVPNDAVALVIGNPWGSAGVLMGSRHDIASTLRGWLALVDPPA